MAANTQPVFTLTPHTAIGASITSANTATDGTGTVQTMFTAGASGSYVKKVVVRALGSNAASVFRVFLNNGGSNTTATNNALIAELSMPVTTASNSVALPSFEIPLEFAMPASYTLLATIGTAVSGGVIPTVIGGDY
jgi:hypothetical protein